MWDTGVLPDAKGPLVQKRPHPLSESVECCLERSAQRRMPSYTLPPLLLTIDEAVAVSRRFLVFALVRTPH